MISQTHFVISSDMQHDNAMVDSRLLAMDWNHVFAADKDLRRVVWQRGLGSIQTRARKGTET